MHHYGFVTANVFIFVTLRPVGSKGQMFEGQEEENTLLEDPNLWPATYFGSMGVGFLIFFLMMFLLYLAMRKEIRAANASQSADASREEALKRGHEARSSAATSPDHSHHNPNSVKNIGRNFSLSVTDYE
ncbi:uncharacterized protein LOC142343848 [Convolutriloba macropyga]|uniref:uncharacterized protein LOC142343848 n=1 Tax=Convolutriloba macropyga TaxID=536237 RepID=UPI003F5227B0